MEKYNNIQSSSTYSKTSFSIEDFIKNNENYCQKFDLKLTYKDCFLTIMYWLPKIYKRPLAARFVIAPKS